MKLLLSKDKLSDLYTVKINGVFITIRKYSYTQEKEIFVLGYISIIYNENNKKSYSSFLHKNKVLSIIDVVKLSSKVLSDESFLNEPIYLEIKL